MIHEGTIFSVGHWTVIPGKEELFIEKWQEFAQWTLNNLKGARWVYMVRDQEQTNKFLSFGPWGSLENMAEWRHSSKFTSAFTEFRELCDEIRTGTMREVVHVKR